MNKVYVKEINIDREAVFEPQIDIFRFQRGQLELQVKVISTVSIDFLCENSDFSYVQLETLRGDLEDFLNKRYTKREQEEMIEQSI